MTRSRPKKPNRDAGTRAAFGPRRPLEQKIRQFTFRSLKAVGLRRLGDGPDYVEFFPEARSATEFADLSTRASCYLGDIDLPFYLPGKRFRLDPEMVPYFEPSLVQDPGWVDARPNGRAFLLTHRTSPATVMHTIMHRGSGAMNVDAGLFMRSELEYWRAREILAWPNYPSPEASLARLQTRFAGASSAFVLATGPSSRTIDLRAIETDIRITCNSAVQDIALLEAYRPNVIAFTDPVFHFGPSRYAHQFRQDMIQAADCYDALIVCGSEWVSPLLHLHPSLEQRLVVLQTRRGGKWRWPSKKNPSVRASVSVLTNVMLPVALMLADKIGVAGVDGRQPDENYFWKHGAQYSDDLMKTVFDAHEAFFRDRDYADYYDEYCEHIEEFLTVAEEAGKSVLPAAASWIPAFVKRGAPQPE